MSRPPASALSGDRTIRANGLSKRYGQTLAVDDLSFEVEPGRVTGFIGPNGAGKTTTMRLLLGLDAPTGGTATIGGLRYRDLPAPMREVGALIDANAIHPSRTAYHHLLSLVQSNGIPARRVGEVLGIVGLESVAHRRAGSFSLGMKQRLGIAAALLGDPPVLMFDEPVNGLDPEGIVWIRQLMRALAAEGRTVFVSSHLMSEMAVTADHVIVVGHGHLLRDKAVSDFIEGDARHHVLVRCLQLDDLTVALTRAGAVVTPGIENSIDVTGMDSNGIGELAASHGFILHELATQQASLEDAFMDLTHDSVEFRTTPAGSAA
ncbi:MAG: ATP-binding cassette domain-containing protein [Actinomycetota bacterium]|nr:ATP-binding cassette domain-containing protein [Actinomycetota bacterium]